MHLIRTHQSYRGLTYLKWQSDSPPRSKWGESNFNDVKERIKAEFSIGSRELSRAIKIIQGHFELAQYIHATPRLPNTSMPLLDLFLDCWVRLHDLDRIKNPQSLRFNQEDLRAYSVDDMIRRSELKEECWKDLESQISPEFIAEITALFYFGHDN